MGRIACYALGAAALAYVPTAQSTPVLTAPASTQLSSGDVQFEMFDDEGLFCDRLRFRIYDSTNTLIINSGILTPTNSGGDGDEGAYFAQGLPVDGTAIRLNIRCTTGNTADFNLTAFDAAGSTDGGTDGGSTDAGDTIVYLDPDATVQLAPDAALQIDSGMTIEQYGQLATAVLLTLATAIGVRQVMKVLT